MAALYMYSTFTLQLAFVFLHSAFGLAFQTSREAPAHRTLQYIDLLIYIPRSF